jgi:hypothetical protein
VMVGCWPNQQLPAFNRVKCQMEDARCDFPDTLCSDAMTYT